MTVMEESALPRRSWRRWLNLFWLGLALLLLWLALRTVDPAQVWVDTWAFDRAVADADRSDDDAAHHAPDRVRQLYRGPFLPAETASA